MLTAKELLPIYLWWLNKNVSAWMTEGKATPLSNHSIQTMEDRKVFSMLMAHFWTEGIWTILSQTQNPPIPTHKPSEKHRSKQWEDQAQYCRIECDLNRQSAWISGMKILQSISQSWLDSVSHDRKTQHFSSFSKQKETKGFFFNYTLRNQCTDKKI